MTTTEDDSQEEKRSLYPAIEPYRKGLLRVSDRHEIYFEECGNPRGQPALFLHGGPGAGASSLARRFFDPERYRIVVFDQRGSGRSMPHGCLLENTTWHLIDDIERLRRHIAVERWLVFGGSWGATLGLAYAQVKPEHVSAMILRGIFLGRRQDIDWFCGSHFGAASFFPKEWEAFVDPIAPNERDDLLGAYFRRLTNADEATVLEAARAWSVWEGSTSRLLIDRDRIRDFNEDRFATAMARIECHYFVNSCFLRSDDQLLQDVGRIRHIPGTIVQGRYDAICPARVAWELHRAWPEAKFRLCPDAGHAALEAGIIHELVSATDEYAGANGR